MGAIRNSLYYVLLYLLPKNWLSCLVGRLVSLHLPRPFALVINRAFARAFKVNLDEAEKALEDYPCLQDFFIRRLKPGVRTRPASNVIMSPCDGVLSIGDKLVDGSLIQAKGKNYQVAELLADQNLARRFLNGYYATLYLSPRDYHRFHVPMNGHITQTTYIPGSLWPVNNWAVENVSNLFCQNERVITLITHQKTKLMLAHIAVGATMVGKIELDYCDIAHEKKAHPHGLHHIKHEEISVEMGQELGKFMFGSTIILLFEPGLIDGLIKDAPNSVKMGEVLGNLREY